ncbi:hypothetical protein [uncultured Bifidobacterium sp.]|uniref:hypothetical protein n=1 Tax=uncultured Bifidobacterium sp. TaxID=165187 RepID=UPI0026021293|nr:hypothetical protein [uncultured Bifidobacterium sp.]
MVTVTGTSYSLAGLDPRQAYYTTTQPFSYRDTLTVLGRMNRVIDNLEIVRQRVEQVADKEQADIDGLIASSNEFKNKLDELSTLVDDLKAAIGDSSKSETVWNVTHGRAEESRDAMRDVYRELAVFGARVEDMASLTAAQAAEHTTLEMAAIGGYTVFNKKEPRVTPVDMHKEQE